jgi:LysM repeat protein
MKKKIIFLLSALVLIHFSYAQKEKGEAYISKYKDIAMSEMQRSGVPAAITLAQGILESQFGESDLCIQSNNHFGIKCKTEWTGEKVYHDDDAKHECFRSYPDAAASFKDHSDFLKNRPYYTDLFKLDPADYPGWAYGLKKAGYATEKDYPQKLMKVINDYNLNQYTLLVLNNKNQMPSSDAVTNTTVAIHSSPEPEPAKELPAAKPVIVNITETEKETEDTRITPVSKKNSINTINTNNYPDGVFTINHTKVLFAKAGTSLLSLANQYDIALSKLIDFNDMNDADILDNASLIFLEKKLKKGSIDFHVVQNNESLLEICQKEGVRLESILEYNGLKKNMQPLSGEKIYLRSNAPSAPKTITFSKNNINNSSK